MKKHKSLCSVIVAVIIVCSFFCACGAEQPVIYSRSDTVTISFSWWGKDPRHEYTLSGIDIFMDLNPKMIIDPEFSEWEGYEKKNQIKMLSASEADVMQINYSWLSKYSPDGNGYYDMYQLSSFIDLSQFSEADLSFGTIDGKLNAIPIALNTSVIYYNQNILDKYGIKAPSTWDDLFEAGELMKADDIYVLGMSKKQMFLFLIAYYEQNYNQYVFNDKGEFLLDQDDVAVMLSIYKQMVDGHVVMPIDDWSKLSLAMETTAGSMFWVSDTESYCTTINSVGKAVIGEFIGMKKASSGYSGWYIKPASMYAISAVSDNPAYSALLVDFLVNNSDMALLQGTEKGIPVSACAYDALYKSNMLDGDAVNSNNLMMDNRSAMRNMVPVMEDSDVIDAFKNGADLYIYGEESLNDAALTVVTEINEIIGE